MLVICFYNVLDCARCTTANYSSLHRRISAKNLLSDLNNEQPSAKLILCLRKRKPSILLIDHLFPFQLAVAYVIFSVDDSDHAPQIVSYSRNSATMWVINQYC